MCDLLRTMEGSSITADHFQHPHKETTGGVFPVSAFSTFHILRNYNNLLFPHPQDISKQPMINDFYDVPSEKLIASLKCKDYTFPAENKSFLRLPHPPGAPTQSILNYPNHLYLNPNDSPAFRHRQLPLSPGGLLSPGSKRQRGEKKPIPDEQKDDKYFERRKRNNQAAKKSRDARKYREDQIAFRAALLEHENAILKAQVLTLREEATSLRQMLLQKKSLELPT